MEKYILYLVDGAFVNERPTDPDIEFDTYVRIVARPGYTLQHIFTYRTANHLILHAGSDAFWREIKLDENK